MKPPIFKGNGHVSPPKCCCCLDVRSGAVCIGLANLIIHAAGLVVATQVVMHPDLYHTHFGETTRDNADNMIGLVVATLSFMITVMLIYGAVMHKPTLILPFFCLQVFDVSVYVLGSAGAVSYAPELKLTMESNERFAYHDEIRKMSMSGFLFSLVMVCMLILCIKAYMISCIWSCYKYAKYRAELAESPAAAIMYNSGTDDLQILLPNYEEATKGGPKESPPPYTPD